MTAPNINPADAEDFIERADDVARLIAGLSEGTISPEYIDRHYGDKFGVGGKGKEGAGPSGSKATPAALPPAPSSKEAVEAAAKEEQRKARLMDKAMALKASYERKLKARAKFEEYSKASADAHNTGTDYTKWDLWCPEDEEDEMINSITPNSAAFRSMEKDIDERHSRMVEARQVAERMRVKGNDAFKAKQWSESLSCYQEGIASERTNMTLHANAAQAAIKINCYVQAIEHCDKALSIADFLHNDLRSPLCTKVYQRRATAYRALQQYARAVQDLQAGVDIEPDNKDLVAQLSKAQRDLDEYRKAKQLSKAMGGKSQGGGEAQAGGGEAKGTWEQDDKAAGDQAVGGLDIEKLRQVETLSQAVSALADVKAAKSVKKSAAPVLPARAGYKASPPMAESPQLRATTAAKALARLLDGDDLAAVYMRESGGFQAAARVVAYSGRAGSDAEERAAVSACLALLNAACMNDGNLALLPSTGVLPHAVALLGSCDAPEAAAAARLLCTAVTDDDVRRAVSKELAAGSALSGVLALLGGRDTGAQDAALSALSNCMVDAPVRQAMRRALAASGGGAGVAAASSASSSGSAAPDGAASTSGQADAASLLSSLLRSPRLSVQERALNLVGNMCGDEVLRGTLGGTPGVLAAMGDAAVNVGTGAGQLPVRLAAANALYNLSLHPGTQGPMLSTGLAAALLLSMQHDDLMLAARCTGVVARCCKHATWGEALLSTPLLENLVALVARCAERPADAAEQQAATAAVSAGAGAARKGDVDCARGLALDAATRALALVTHDEAEHGAAASVALLALGAPKLLLDVVRQMLPPSAAGSSPAPLRAMPVTKSTRESILGNATLAVGHFARSAEVLPLLAELDAVAPLVAVAYEGRGNVASKNAAIALARMAKAQKMLERLRELHGLEIIYQYVRP
ncbi:hypothetical protein FOA52_005320 [Chlamydomonas sp. UWO 241]|nr:hypothetical protein FOA52_005320 [Chlamydomonas sp. UWO 241]